MRHRQVNPAAVVANWGGSVCFKRTGRLLLIGATCTLAVGHAVASTLFDSLIQKVALEERVDPVLLRAVVATESDFDPNANSRKGAMGLMQLMPGTAKLMGVRRPYHPEDNLRGGARYLRTLIDRFDRVDYALAGYNAGPENIAKYNGIPPFQETVEYVAKVRDKYREQIYSGSEIASRRWHSASISDPVVVSTSSPRYASKPVSSPKKIFVYRDTKGTLVLTDIQPKRRGDNIATSISVIPANAKNRIRIHQPRENSTIRISAPVREIPG